jgi:predicted homoserine dehydrogenase-like protein
MLNIIGSMTSMTTQPAFSAGRPVKLGLAGTGFIGSGLLGLLEFREDFALSKVLTRRNSVPGVDSEMLTSSKQELAESCDIVIECTGDVSRAAGVINAAFEAGKPVVTMGAEFQVTLGSYFAGRGFITEAEGDQPGSIAALREEAIDMGFEPLVYGNIKGFLNHHPLPDEMHHWAERNGISLAQVTSFTDGTKLQIEQALVANGLDADIAQRGLLGPKDEALDVSAANMGRTAKAMGISISDYVLNRTLPAGVFVTGEHHSANPNVLRYLKLGEGPFYTLMRPYHLCHLEMFKTLRRVASGGKVLLNNSVKPRINVASVAKRDLKPGTTIGTAIGGFDVRGEALRFSEDPFAVPVGLLANARITRKVSRGQTLTWSDVDLPDCTATHLGMALHEQRLAEMQMLPLAQTGQV